jgi:hypothetical protein
MPELLWKAYIDFEIEEGDREKARSLYERLVNLSGHHKVWISYAEFEGSSIPVPRALREEERDRECQWEGKKLLLVLVIHEKFRALHVPRSPHSLGYPCTLLSACLACWFHLLSYPNTVHDGISGIVQF